MAATPGEHDREPDEPGSLLPNELNRNPPRPASSRTLEVWTKVSWWVLLALLVVALVLAGNTREPGHSQCPYYWRRPNVIALQGVATVAMLAMSVVSEILSVVCVVSTGKSNSPPGVRRQAKVAIWAIPLAVLGVLAVSAMLMFTMPVPC